MSHSSQERGNRRDSTEGFIARLGGGNTLVILSVLPVLYLLAAAPDSFTLGWNVGRGGLLFATVFLVFEFLDARRQIHFNITKARLGVILTLLAAVLIYFTSVVFLGLQQHIWNLGQSLNIPLLYSWIWIWDFLALGIYFTSIGVVALGFRGLRMMPTPVIYLFGMTLILLLDALFPYDTLGPLQSVVPLILTIDTSIVSLLSIGKVVATGNLLFLEGRHGPFSLAVFWPSAGVHSMIIYSLIMLALLVKLDMPNRRRLYYFGVGAVGTFFINVIRILLLSIYVLLVSTKVAEFEAFHAIAGEVLFIPWVVAYVLLVSWFEARRISRTGHLETLKR